MRQELTGVDIVIMAHGEDVLQFLLTLGLNNGH